MAKEQYIKVAPECLDNLINVFSDSEELKTFGVALYGLIEENIYLQLSSKQNELDFDTLRSNGQRRLFTFAFFCREYIDIIHELIKVLDYEICDKEEFEKFLEMDKDAEGFVE